MASHQASRDKPRAAKCNHFCHPFDTHNFCPTCREAGKGDDPCVTLVSSCTICSSFTEEQITKISHRKRYSKKSEMAADRLFTSPPRPQPISFEALSSRTPARTVPPTPGTALQLKVQANLEKSLSSHINIQMDQKMGAFQASMLQAFNNLREDFQKSLQKPREVDQTSSSSATKTNAPSKDLDKPSKASSAIESMEVEYGPDLPPRLDSYSSRLEDNSGQLRSSAEDPSQVASTKPKQAAHSPRYHVVDPSSVSDHYSDYSIDPQPAPSRPKKHSDKSKHKSRSRFLTPSSEEDQSPEHRHRSPKPSRKSYSDQDHPQHDPDPPYYREVALSDIPSQYAEEVDTFRCILKLPDPRESLPIYRKGGKCKISRVLQSPVSSTQASPKGEASDRPKQAQHFSTCRKVQDGVHQNLPDSRGMGCVDRSIGRLPSHPHPSSLKEIPKILPQVSGVPVHLPTFRTGHSPPGLYHDRKGGEAHGPLQRSQT